MPIMVTENGIATEDDTRRVAFIDEAAKGVEACIADHIPVIGYCHWSLLDNFEWQKGFSMKFGLIAVDRSTMKRMPKKVMMNITNFPMVNPEIVTGVSMMLLFVAAVSLFGGKSLGMASLIIAHITFCLPYVILSVLPKLRQMNPNLFEAAQDLGCPPVRAFFKVVLPEIMPGIVTGMIMAFTLSIDDFVISYFTSGTTQTLPIYIYSMTRKRISPEINALSTVLFVCIMLCSSSSMSARDVKSAVPKRQKGSVPDEKKFFAIFLRFWCSAPQVVPAFADEADDWDFSEEYPTAEPTGVTIQCLQLGRVYFKRHRGLA